MITIFRWTRPMHANDLLASRQDMPIGVAGPSTRSKLGAAASKLTGRANAYMLFRGNAWSPPPISDVILNTEACFLISLDAVNRACGDVDILSASKSKVMHMSIVNSELALFSEHMGGAPMVSVSRVDAWMSNE